MDTNTNSYSPPRSWALWAALALIAAGLIAVLYVVFAASSKPGHEAALQRFARGEMAALQVLESPPPMPARTLSDAAGQPVSLAGLYSSEVLVLNLWATWCAPCIEEMPTLAALQQRFAGRGVDVAVVSVDGEAHRARAEAQLTALSGGTLAFLIDPSRGVLFDVAAVGMPVTIIYGRDGRERARLSGGADWGGDDAAALIEAVLEGQ